MPDENSPEKKKGKLRFSIDKLVMGAIIGGAIGSVLGMALAPRKGKETRKILKEKGKELAENAKRESRNLYDSIKEKITPGEEIQEKNEDAATKIPREEP